MYHYEKQLCFFLKFVLCAGKHCSLQAPHPWMLKTIKHLSLKHTWALKHLFSCPTTSLKSKLIGGLQNSPLLAQIIWWKMANKDSWALFMPLTLRNSNEVSFKWCLFCASGDRLYSSSSEWQRTSCRALQKC